MQQVAFNAPKHFAARLSFGQLATLKVARRIVCLQQPAVVSKQIDSVR